MLQINNILVFPILIIMSFLLGSIPFGLVIGRLYGVDIRDHGSRNIGSTNVYRVLGKLPAFLTFSLDITKGVLVILLVKTLVPSSDFDLSVVLIFVIFSIFVYCFVPFNISF